MAGRRNAFALSQKQNCSAISLRESTPTFAYSAAVRHPEEAVWTEYIARHRSRMKGWGWRVGGRGEIDEGRLLKKLRRIT